MALLGPAVKPEGDSLGPPIREESSQSHCASHRIEVLPLIVREAAQEDIREAVDWYERQSSGLG